MMQEDYFEEPFKPKFKHVNRTYARKQKQGCGCKLCKPWKGKWDHRFKRSDRAKMKINI